MSNERGKGAASATLPPTAKPLITEIYQLIQAGRAAEALPRLGKLEDLMRGSPTFLSETEGAVLVDIGTEIGSLELVKRGVSLLAAIEVSSLSKSAQWHHWYNLGNGHAQLYYFRKDLHGVEKVLDDEFQHTKDCYRKVMALPPGSAALRAGFCTNYGILLRSVGRHVEEIEAYDEALMSVPDFAMALWHKARGLRCYSGLVERPTKRSALLEAQHLLRKGLRAGLEPRRQAKAEQELTQLERILKEPKVPAAHKQSEHIAHSDIEAKYIKFCVGNRLYLHPCPMHVHEAYQDPLSVRFPALTKNECLELRDDDLALIKQEYIAARFLLFAYRLEQPDLSFVDRGAHLPSLQERSGQIYLQLLILSFRAAFAILDKIAFFLNKFCKIREKPIRVSFRKELFLADSVLRPELIKYNGQQLAALFDLACEFSKDQPLYRLKDLRHKLEHRCVRLRRAQDSSEVGGASASQARLTQSKAVEELNDNELYENALCLMRAVRAAVFYLFFFVRKSVEPPRAGTH
jgi:hypothetical protein